VAFPCSIIRRLFAPSLLVVLTLGALDGARADLTLRCNNEIVDSDDRKFDVLRKCGEPDFIDRWFEGLAYGYPFGVEVEEWYYSDAPNRLVRMLRFRNHRLVDVDTGGYGIGDELDGSCGVNDIDPGLTKFELLLRCGQPAASEAWTEFRGDRLGDVYTYPVSVRVEEWIYSFGTHQFIRYVTLVNGRVTDVDTGERDD
jgi:hypothetical protein